MSKGRSIPPIVETGPHSFVLGEQDDPLLAQHDAAHEARAEMRRLLYPDTNASQIRDLLDAIDRALAGPLQEDERERLEKLATLNALAAKRPALASAKAAKNVYAAEALKLIRIVELVAEHHHRAPRRRRWSVRKCAQAVVVALKMRSWSRAAAHAHLHADLIERAIAAWPRGAGRQRDGGPPTFNQALVDLLCADDFAPLSKQTVKNLRAGRGKQAAPP